MRHRTNLDIKDAACLHIVHILQHPTSRPITKSTQTTMVYAQKLDFSPLAAGKYGKSTQWSTQQHHQANEGKSGLEAERGQALGALRSLRSNKKRGAEEQCEMHYLVIKEKAKFMEDYVEREPTGARKRVEDAEAAVQQAQNDTRKPENAGLTNWEPWKTCQEMMVVVRDSLSDLAGSDGGEVGDNEVDEQIEQGHLGEDDEPGWVMGTITKTVQQHIERFGRSRWSLMNWHDRDGRTQPIHSVKKSRSTAHPNWGFQQSFNCKRIMMQWHLHRQRLERLRIVLTFSPEYRRSRMGPLDEEVVMLGYVLRSRSRTQIYPVLPQLQCLIHHSLRMWSLSTS